MTNWDYPTTSHTVAAVAAAEPLPLMAAVRGVQAGLAERFPCSGCALSVHFPLIKTKTKLVRLHAAATTTATAQQQPQLETDQIAFGFRFGFGLSCASSRHRHRRDGVWSLYNPVNFFKVFSSHYSLPLWHHSLFGARAARLFHRFATRAWPENSIEGE